MKLITELVAPAFERGLTWTVRDMASGDEIEVMVFDKDFWEKVRKREYLAFAHQVIVFEGVMLRKNVFRADRVLEWEKAPANGETACLALNAGE